jgi:hypothetical protein
MVGSMPSPALTAWSASSDAALREMCALARDKLKTQTSRTAALDTNTLGVMALDMALGAIVLSSGRTSLWVAALALLCLSLALAAGALSLPGAKRTGPSIARLRRKHATIDDIELLQRLLTALEQAIRANGRATIPKAMLYHLALTLLMSAIVLELAGRL